MSPLRDPTIKLFGKTIPLSSFKLAASAAAEACADSASADEVQFEVLDDESSREVEEADEKKQVVEVDADDYHGESSNKCLRNGSTSPRVIDVDGSVSENLKNGDQSENTGELKDRTLKKPDKIIPCPRCNSMETKFCYYNNYNVNQPRHFCKKCQRYWTAGGSMRNVPVGSGRRKTKSSGASVCRQMMVNEGILQDNPCGDSNGVLRFGPDAPFCDSMANVLSLAEDRDSCEYGIPDKRIHVVGNGDNSASNPNSSASVLTDKGSQSQDTVKNFQGYPPQIACFPGPPWAIPWNPAMPAPNAGHGGYPVAYYSLPSYWSSGMMSSWIHPSSISPPSTASTHSSLSTNPKSPTLGKHTREGAIMNSTNSDAKAAHDVKVAPSEPKASRGIWYPKTLRIDDPNEAAKSSIWETLGIQNERSSINEGQMFKSFPSKGSHKGLERRHPLHINPAALSRSQTFHETTPMKHTSA